MSHAREEEESSFFDAQLRQRQQRHKEEELCIPFDAATGRGSERTSAADWHCGAAMTFCHVLNIIDIDYTVLL